MKKLVPGDTYIISDAYEINDGIESEKLLKLSNPWGDAEYSGDWGETSSKNGGIKRKIEVFTKKR